MQARITNGHDADDEALALQALAWTLAEPERAQRLLALTGLDADDLRARIGEPAVLAAALGFLEGHEADLVDCAGALGVPAPMLVAARARLDGGLAA